MRTLKLVAPVMMIAACLSGCRAFQSNAVRDLAESEVKHLERLHEGLVRAGGPTAVTTSSGSTVEIGTTGSLSTMASSWDSYESTFRLWDAELDRVSRKALAPTPVPSVNARGGELADLALRALGQETVAAREASDFEAACLALGEAQQELTSGVQRMLAQAKEVRDYTAQPKASLFLTSLDVAAIGGALSEFEEGRQLLEDASELAPEIDRLTGRAEDLASALDLEGETLTEIQMLMGILTERMTELEATDDEDQEDEE